MDDEPEVLTEQESAILDMETHWWRFKGSKESAIVETMGISPTRYYQLLHQLIQTERAVKAEPVLVYRMRRQAVARSRYINRLGSGPDLAA